MVRTGGPGLAETTLGRIRTPAGHPEGYIEAFANIYRAVAATIRGGDAVAERGAAAWFPGTRDGVRTMAFVEAVVANAALDQKWSGLAG